jgi:hypothetical protein
LLVVEAAEEVSQPDNHEPDAVLKRSAIER